jgi:hypothetical protein
MDVKEKKEQKTGRKSVENKKVKSKIKSETLSKKRI